ncbi:MAG TPA: hypothetical protein VNX28_13800 [Gemmataceae bacterium]|jgi:hypothetical protein|nr:hypothetical protein [Gemmataceae bacterium]
MQPPFPDDNEPYPPFLERRPRTGIPKTIGVLNIVFGSLLLLCGICFGLSLAMQLAMGPIFAGQQQQMQQIMEAGRRQQLQDLQDQEQAAQDEKEKAAIQARLKALQGQPIPKMPDMAKFTQDMGLQSYGIADVVTGLVLNILMVISGVGLVSVREWGRRLGLWVATLKIVRLIALYSIFILVVVPNITNAFTTMFREMFEEMAKVAQPGQHVPGPAEMGQMGQGLGIMYSAFAIGMIVLGVIYPVIMLILLSRPHVKAACAPAAIAQDDSRRD